jgi:hypothetical protein
MNRAGQEPLAGPRLAFYEYRRQPARILLPSQEPHDLLTNRLDPRAVTEQIRQGFHGSSILLAGQYGVQLLTSAGSDDSMACS